MASDKTGKTKSSSQPAKPPQSTVSTPQPPPELLHQTAWKSLKSWPAIGFFVVAWFGAFWTGKLADSRSEPYLLGAALCTLAFLAATNLTKTQSKRVNYALRLVAVVLAAVTSCWIFSDDKFHISSITHIASQGRAGVQFFSLLHYENNSPTIYPIHLVDRIQITNLRRKPTTINAYFVETEIEPNKWVQVPTIKVGLGRVVLTIDPSVPRGTHIETPTLDSVLGKGRIDPGDTADGLAFFEMPDEGKFGANFRMTLIDSLGNLYRQPIHPPPSQPAVGHRVNDLQFMITTNETFSLLTTPSIFYSDRYGINGIPKVRK